MYLLAFLILLSLINLSQMVEILRRDLKLKVTGVVVEIQLGDDARERLSIETHVAASKRDHATCFPARTKYFFRQRRKRKLSYVLP